MNIKVVTFYQNNIPKKVVHYQKKVLVKFNVPLEQVLVNVPHSHAIDNYIKSTPFDYLILLDIDAIPLKAAFVEEIVKIINSDTLFGIAQQSNHIEPQNHPYAGPACLGLSKELYSALGRPSFRETSRSDCAEELTWLAEEKGFKVHLLWPSHVVKAKWPLGDNYVFGVGTTYDDLIFHTFEMGKYPIRNSRLFIQQCKSVLGEKSSCLDLWLTKKLINLEK